VAAVTISGDRMHAESVLTNVERDAANFLGGHLAETTVEWLE
jgi:hypothetical protein